MGRRRFPGGETIREIYASSYGESHGVRVQIIEIRMGARGLPGGGDNSGIYASSYVESHGVRVQIIGIRICPQECSEGKTIREVGRFGRFMQVL